MIFATHALTIRIERLIEDALARQDLRAYRVDGRLYVTHPDNSHVNCSLIAREIADALADEVRAS